LSPAIRKNRIELLRRKTEQVGAKGRMQGIPIGMEEGRSYSPKRAAIKNMEKKDTEALTGRGTGDSDEFCISRGGIRRATGSLAIVKTNLVSECDSGLMQKKTERRTRRLSAKGGSTIIFIL